MLVLSPVSKSVASLVFFQSGPDSVILEGHAPHRYTKGSFSEVFSVKKYNFKHPE